MSIRPSALVRIKPQSWIGCGGFSLVEMMIVIVILAILSATIIPEMRGTFGDAQLKSTTRELVQLVGTAQIQAAAKSERFWLVLDPGPEGDTMGLFHLVQQMGSGHQLQPVTEMPGVRQRLGKSLSCEILTHNLESNDEAGMGIPSGILPENSGRMASTFSDSELPPDNICFFPDGTCDRKRIHIRDRDGFGLEIVLNPLTSNPSVRKLERVQ